MTHDRKRAFHTDCAFFVKNPDRRFYARGPLFGDDYLFPGGAIDPSFRILVHLVARRGDHFLLARSPPFRCATCRFESEESCATVWAQMEEAGALARDAEVKGH
jgi:hypothetical protein